MTHSSKIELLLDTHSILFQLVTFCSFCKGCVNYIYIYIVIIYIYIYIYIYITGGTVHVFVPNRHGTDFSVRCIRLYDKYRQFTPNPEGGTRSNATLFDNRQRQQKNRKCHELHAWKQSLLDSDHVLILNASLTWTAKSFSHGLTRALCLCILPLSFGTNPNIP